VSSGTLYIVATPVGNLEDVTIRALEVLRNADLIACEDTRKSRVLLQRFRITTALVSLHKFSESRKVGLILERLAAGQTVALISDAGTPAISDPGDRLVKAARDAGVPVLPVPGPSSITAALSVSGMDCSSFVYLGYAPRKDEQRREFFTQIVNEKRTSVFFETPHRIRDLVKIAADMLGSRRITLFRELTKLHEEAISGTASEIHAELSARESVKGEIVFVVEGASRVEPEIGLEEAVKSLAEEGLTGKRLAAEAQARFGFKKHEAYEMFLRIKKGCADTDK